MDLPPSERICWRAPAIASAALLLAAMWASLASAGAPVLRVDATPAGKIRLEARGARLSEVLRAIASKADFNVVIDDGISRPPVDLVLAPISVEEVLLHVLNDRNYMLLYAEDTGALSCVIVLPPSTPRSPFQRQPPAPVRRR